MSEELKKILYDTHEVLRCIESEGSGLIAIQKFKTLQKELAEVLTRDKVSNKARKNIIRNTNFKIAKIGKTNFIKAELQICSQTPLFQYNNLERIQKALDNKKADSWRIDLAHDIIRQSIEEIIEAVYNLINGIEQE